MRLAYLLPIVLVLVLSSIAVTAQTVIGADTPIATTKSTQITFNNGLIVNSAGVDLSQATLTLKGTDQSLQNGTGGTPLVLGGLIIGQLGAGVGGTVSVTGGAWEVAGPIEFNDGLVVPSSDGKIVHTLATDASAGILVNNPESFVNGTFYSKGLGTRFFPIGNSNGFFPAQLFNVTQGDVEIGMRVEEADASLSHGNEILSVFDSRYWELIDPSNSLVGPLLALSTFQTSDFIEPTVGTVLVGASKTGTGVNSLGGSLNGDYVVGATGISAGDRVFTLAKINSDKVGVKIHNVITPFRDNANDYLLVENIDVFPENTVILMDRWGGKVKEWKNYSNFSGSPNTTLDLSDIETGNYICVVQYDDGKDKRRISQMVTIINNR